MRVTIKFYGIFRGVLGKNKFVFEIKNEDMVSLRELVNKMTDDIPKINKVLIDPELEDPRPNALILVNGKEISVLNGLETLIKDGDEVVFISILHAG